MNILIYILLFFIIFILIIVCKYIYYNIVWYLHGSKNYNKKKNIINNIKSIDFYTDVSSYRLGDGFYLTEDKSRWDSNTKNDLNSYHYKSLKSIIKQFPDSILAEYLLKSNYKQQKYNVLLDILNNRFIKDKTINTSNSVLIHIRLGDVIDRNCKNKCFIKKFYYNQESYLQQHKNLFNFWRMYKLSKYIQYYKYYVYIARKLKKLGIINLYIICGAHIKLNDYKYSTYYLKEIIKIFKDYDLNIHLNISKHPDEDLLFSMNFNYFVPSYGQYSNLISDINKRNNKNFNII